MTEVKRMQIFGPLTTTERDALGLGPGDAYRVAVLNATATQWEFWDGSAWQVVPSDNPNFVSVTVGSGVLLLSASGISTSVPITLTNGRLLLAQGQDIASANNLSLAGGIDEGNVYEITGTTQINLISKTSWQDGSVITLLFTSTPTVKHNQSTSGDNTTILLEGGVDFVAAAGDRLTLVLSEIGGTEAWREVSRTRAAAYSGTYTPTLTNVANLDASTAYQCQWSRVGNIVTVSGKVDVDPTLAATATQLGISLPVASNLGAQEDCAGTAFASGIAGQGAAIRGDATNDRAEMVWVSGDITNQPMYFTFTYEVI